MEIESLFGLPAHPLVVHAAVVLLPLAALVTLVTAAIPKARRPYAPIALGLAIIAAVSVSAARGSGEELQHQVNESELVEEHAEHGEVVLPWAIGLAVVAGAVTVAGPLHRRYPDVSPKAVTGVLLVAAVITAGGSTWSVAEAGHSGAKATWDDLPARGAED